MKLHMFDSMEIQTVGFIFFDSGSSMRSTSCLIARANLLFLQGSSTVMAATTTTATDATATRQICLSRHYSKYRGYERGYLCQFVIAKWLNLFSV